MKWTIYDPFTRKTMWVNNPLKQADLVEIVRCKDCVHANITGEGYIYGTCNHRLKGGIGHLITPQFFCAYGERKDDGDNH